VCRAYVQPGAPDPLLTHPHCPSPSLIENFEQVATSTPAPSTPTASTEAPKAEKKPVEAPKKAPEAKTPKATQAAPVPAVSLEELKQDSKFAKYCKMISVGVPRPNVYGKMAGDGLSPRSVELFKCVPLARTPTHPYLPSYLCMSSMLLRLMHSCACSDYHR
jgi:hypothetical protein